MKVFNQTSAVPVYALLDLSASMAFAGIADKRATLSDFVTALGYSAYRTGDAFGYVGFDHAPCPQFVVSPRTAPGVGVELAARLRTYAFPGRSAQGIVAATRLLGMQPALVFVVSDFYFPLRLWASALAAMTRHRVVPLVLHDRAESLQLPKLWPRLRLARIVDPETGAARTLLLRRSLCRRIQAHRARHRERLSALCHAHDCAPLFVEGEFSPASVTRYFNG
ncbi:MAG: hypothetical protein GKR94_04645 [Gammaproteobacteria bacterium]|nr:hypothetical protein [Gammaproteobacteria bacterium]